MQKRKNNNNDNNKERKRERKKNKGKQRKTKRHRLSDKLDSIGISDYAQAVQFVVLNSIVSLTKDSYFFSYHLACGSFRRAPDSYTDQRYYSWMAYDFKAKDGVKRYARFHLMPADGRPETGLLTENDQRNVWWVLMFWL